MIGPRHIVRVIRTAHCKRGPDSCATCRDMDVPTVCALDIDPPDRGLVQRRVLEVEIDGCSEWREFDVVATFPNADAALAWAAEHGVDDVELSED